MEARYRWSLVAVTSIWLSVLVTSLFAPDFVSGSQQEHIRIAALANWLWGAMATVGVLRAVRATRSSQPRNGAWTALGIAVSVLWTAVALVSLAAPVLETGSDPTRIPLAAILSPIVAMLFTRYLAEFLADLPATDTGDASTQPRASLPALGEGSPQPSDDHADDAHGDNARPIDPER